MCRATLADALDGGSVNAMMLLVASSSVIEAMVVTCGRSMASLLGWCKREEAAQRGRCTDWDHLKDDNDAQI